MKRTRQVLGLGAAAVFAVAIFASSPARAHCQIPCGIYGDQARFESLYEHIATIEKSMNQINELSKDGATNANQVVRWVMNKEQHADAMAEIITKYFLQQRIKPGDIQADHAGWMQKAGSCHKILVSSMKAKQTTDLAHVEDLRKQVDAFAKAYLSKEDLAHLQEHHAH